MQNPIEKIRERASMTSGEFAVALGLTYHTIYRVEAGHVKNLQPELLEALTERGFDGAQLAREYAEWLSNRGANLDATLRERLGAAV